MGAHVMIDIETLDTLPTAVILSIGAVRFNPYDDHLINEFSTGVDVASCQAAGLTIGADTVRWWFRQGTTARIEAISSDCRLSTALSNLRWWFLESPVEAVWSHGPSFDLVILENAYRAIGLPHPWHHRDQRCTRTIYNLAGVSLKDHQEGVAHTALADARGQARTVIAAYRALGLVMPNPQEEGRA